MSEPLALLDEALAQAARVISSVHPDQSELPTPCRSWRVHTLADHMIFDLDQFTAAAKGHRPQWTGPPPEAEGDWGKAFREGAGALLTAWREFGDLSAAMRLPYGELPASFVVMQQTAEFATHTWDLAVATGQTFDGDLAVAEAALAWAKTALQPQQRGDEASGKVFGPEVVVPADAPAYQRLAAFFGRVPA